jgi:hypothetical protein
MLLGRAHGQITNDRGSEMISKNSETFQTMLTSQLQALQDLASVDRALKGGLSFGIYLVSHLLTSYRQTLSRTKNKVEICQT